MKVPRILPQALKTLKLEKAESPMPKPKFGYQTSLKLIKEIRAASKALRSSRGIVVGRIDVQSLTTLADFSFLIFRC